MVAHPELKDRSFAQLLEDHKKQLAEISRIQTSVSEAQRHLERIEAALKERAQEDGLGFLFEVKGRRTPGNGQRSPRGSGQALIDAVVEAVQKTKKATSAQLGEVIKAKNPKANPSIVIAKAVEAGRLTKTNEKAGKGWVYALGKKQSA